MYPMTRSKNQLYNYILYIYVSDDMGKKCSPPTVHFGFTPLTENTNKHFTKQNTDTQKQMSKHEIHFT